MDRGSPCCQEQEGGPGSIHSAGEGVGKGNRLEQMEVGRNRSSFQVKDIRERQRHSELEQPEKLEHRKRRDFHSS